jgi:hypothetical protein
MKRNDIFKILFLLGSIISIARYLYGLEWQMDAYLSICFGLSAMLWRE